MTGAGRPRRSPRPARHPVLILGLAALLVLVGGGPAAAVTHAEVGDAGDLLPTAQVPSGSGALTQITGTVSHREDVDLYKICVDSNAAFSATTSGTPTGPGTLANSQLFLFNAAGNGVVHNDDDTVPVPGPPTPTRSTLPAGNNPGPGSGTYYLAISAYNTDALNAPSPEGFLIFPDAAAGEVVGDIGVDPRRVLGGWNDNLDNPLSPSTYVINLTGAQPWADPCPPPPTTTPTPATACAATTIPAGAIVGSPGPDSLVGTAGDDVIFGLGGDDRIAGLGGNDTLVGGAGFDRIAGGDGDDLLCGGTETDHLAGGDGDDRMAGEAGDDQLSGADGADGLDGGANDDQLVGGLGDDTLDGGTGTNTNHGGAGTDICLNGTPTACGP